MAAEYKLVPWVYDLLLWLFSILVDLFFREVHPRSAWRVPRHGPVIFVAAPHANQFVDPLILMRILRTEAHRRLSNLIAAKSISRPFVGTMARIMGSIPVGRALDSARPGSGRIYLPDAANDPLLVRGVDTRFDKEAQVGGRLVLPTVNGSAASSEVLQILGPEEIRLKREFKGEDALEQLTGGRNGQAGIAEGFRGSPYKVAPKVDQTKVYNAVFDRLNEGGCVCIFPEGGSHDRTELLPLKAGVAIMALGSLAANPDSGLKIIPCGMNYFHAHKFRSRAVVEFGAPIEVPKDLVDLYRAGERREATGQLLEIIYQGLLAVTVTSPDYETLMLIQAARRLYKPKGKKLPLPKIIELNRRMIKGYTVYKDDARIINLKASVNEYNRQLKLLAVRDHQVEYAKFSIPKVVSTLVYRTGKLAVLSIGTLPGLVLFAPVFITTKLISLRKSREALAESTVKLAGRDVMATWKLLVALAFAPMLYTFYDILLAYWVYRNRVQGYVPAWVPLWVVLLFGYVLFPAVTFAALRVGETGMDILKSLRPLALSLNPTSANTLVRLRERREELAAQVTELINTLGPELFDDFSSARIVTDASSSATTPPLTPGGASKSHEPLPRNESFGNLGTLSFFASPPHSRSRSRARSGSEGGGGGGGGGTAFRGPLSGMTTKAGLEEVSKKIRGAMAERGKRRERTRSAGSWDFAGTEATTTTGSGAHTPASEAEGKKEI